MKYDLEVRTEKLAINVRLFVRSLSRTISNLEDVKQLVGASGSIAANYIEANEALSKKDFFNRIKICKKEAKESALFLHLLDTSNDKVRNEKRNELVDEAKQLVLIFQKILESDKQK